LQPISKCVEVDGESITFWCKEIDEAVIHRMKAEMDFRGKDFIAKNGYHSADIVYGTDHGARQFHVVVKLIIQNSNNINVTPLSAYNCYLDRCDKENKTILEKTIAKPTNDGLQRV
jgi:hypothetical protein